MFTFLELTNRKNGSRTRSCLSPKPRNPNRRRPWRLDRSPGRNDKANLSARGWEKLNNFFLRARPDRPSLITRKVRDKNGHVTAVLHKRPSY